MAVARVADSSENADIVGVAGGVGVGHGKSVSHLPEGVSIRLALSVVDPSVARVANSSDNTDVVRMAGGVGVGQRESQGNLADGVRLGIRVGDGNGQEDLKIENKKGYSR